jgi:hypothetical protein
MSKIEEFNKRKIELEKALKFYNDSKLKKETTWNLQTSAASGYVIINTGHTINIPSEFQNEVRNVMKDQADKIMNAALRNMRKRMILLAKEAKAEARILIQEADILENEIE